MYVWLYYMGLRLGLGRVVSGYKYVYAILVFYWLLHTQNHYCKFERKTQNIKRFIYIVGTALYTLARKLYRTFTTLMWYIHIHTTTTLKRCTQSIKNHYNCQFVFLIFNCDIFTVVSLGSSLYNIIKK